MTTLTGALACGRVCSGDVVVSDVADVAYDLDISAGGHRRQEAIAQVARRVERGQQADRAWRSMSARSFI